MVWPFQKKCTTPADGDNIFYELILDINDNPLVRRFWVKSRLRKRKRLRRDTSLNADHVLQITIEYRIGPRHEKVTIPHNASGEEVEWAKTISGGAAGQGGPEEVRPISIKVDGTATRNGKSYNLICEKGS